MRYTLTLLLPLLPLAAVGAAQPPGPPGPVPPDTVQAELPAIEVMASILSGAGSGVASGVPARTFVLGAAALAVRQPRLLPEALANEPGLSLYDDLGSAYKPTLLMRGFAVSPVVGLPQGISVFVDGVPVNEPDAGQVNFDLLPGEHLARVELLSGTASLLGPHSLGGAINLVTRRGAGSPVGEVELEAGSFGATAARASLGGSRRGWSYYLGAGASREDGWRQRTGASAQDALVNLGRYDERSGVGLQLIATRSSVQTAGSLPFSAYRVRPDSNLSAGDFEDLLQLHLALSGYAPAGGGQASFRAYFRGHDAERFNVNQANDPDVRSFSLNRTLGASADWRWSHALPAGEVALRVGVEGTANRVSIRLFAERIEPGLTTYVHSPISSVAAYGLLDYSRGPLTLSAGLRADGVRVPFRNQLNPTRDTTSHFVRLSPRGGVRLDLGHGASAYASLGQSFRAPAVIELACADPQNPCPLPFALGDDPPLNPVVATTAEAGAQWSHHGLSLRGALYRTRVRDDIFLFPYDEEGEPEGSTIDGFFANLPRTRRMGIELDARLQSRAGSDLYLNYAFTRATFEVEGVQLFSIREEAGAENVVEPGDQFPLVPTHTARAGASLALPRKLRFGVDANYTGERWLRGDEANEEARLAAFLRVDASATLPLRRWTLQGVVENVFDGRYAAFGTFNFNQGAGGMLERFLTPGSPRRFRLIVRRKFGDR